MSDDLTDGDRAVLAELRALRDAVSASQPADEQARRDALNAALRVVRGANTAAPHDLSSVGDVDGTIRRLLNR